MGKDDRRFLVYVNDNFGDQRMSKLEYCTKCVWSSCVFLAFDSANFLYYFYAVSNLGLCLFCIQFMIYLLPVLCMFAHTFMIQLSPFYAHTSVCFVSSVWYNYHCYILETSHFLYSHASQSDQFMNYTTPCYAYLHIHVC